MVSRYKAARQAKADEGLPEAPDMKVEAQGQLQIFDEALLK